MTVQVIVPTYNERDNLALLTERLLQHRDLSVLVVDDDSPDGTGAIADELALAHPDRVEVMHRSGPRGLGQSYVDGIRRALAGAAHVICQMDADFSHDPRYLPEMIAGLARADLVIGSRYAPGGTVVNWPMRRVYLSKFANHYIRTTTGLPVRDCTSGFRCWRREALARNPLKDVNSRGYAFLVETLVEASRRGCRIVERPITFVERRTGRSKLSAGVLIESAVVPLKMSLRQRHARAGRSARR